MKAIEEEAVLSARFVYHMLITLCAAAVIFSFSPQKESVNETSIKELNILIDFRESELVWNEALRDKRVQSFFDKLTNIFSNPKIKLERSGRRPMPNLISRAGSAPTFSATLEEVDRHVTQTKKIVVSFPILDETAEAYIRQKLSTSNKEGTYFLQFSKTGLTFLDEDGNYTEWHFSNENWERLELDFDLLALLKSDHRFSSMVGQSGGVLIFLPASKEIWNQIRSENAVDARAIVARQGSSKEPLLEVFGLKIPQHLISWAVPAIIFASSVYLQIHLSYLQLLADKNPQIKAFPWVLTIPGRLALVTCFVTILVIPTLAIVSIAVATWSGGGMISRVVSILTGIATIILLTGSLFTILKLRTSAEVADEGNILEIDAQPGNLPFPSTASRLSK